MRVSTQLQLTLDWWWSSRGKARAMAYQLFLVCLDVFGEEVHQVRTQSTGRDEETTGNGEQLPAADGVTAESREKPQ